MPSDTMDDVLDTESEARDRFLHYILPMYLRAVDDKELDQFFLTLNPTFFDRFPVHPKPSYMDGEGNINAARMARRVARCEQVSQPLCPV